MLGVEIWNNVGNTPPAGEGDLRFVAVDTNAPFVLNFPSADGGKPLEERSRIVAIDAPRERFLMAIEDEPEEEPRLIFVSDWRAEAPEPQPKTK